MLIKTNCEGCIFKFEFGGCELAKPIYVKEKQYVDGLCGHRRENKWIDKLIENDPSFTADKAFEYAQGEHLTLSVVICALTVEMDKISKTVDSIPSDSWIRQIIVVTQDATKQEEQAILDRIANKGYNSWTLDNILRTDYISELSAINYSSRLVKNLWFLSLEAGETVWGDEWCCFWDYINEVESNYIGFYFDEDDPIKTIAHTGAFQIMDGHAEKPWLNKVKDFDNWQNVCKRIH